MGIWVILLVWRVVTGLIAFYTLIVVLSITIRSVYSQIHLSENKCLKISLVEIVYTGIHYMDTSSTEV